MRPYLEQLEDRCSPAVVVAVVDSGLNIHDPYFAGKIWQNPGEIAGNKIDDDGNGFVDDVNGWNFLAKNNNLEDELGHGTKIAKIILSRAPNAQIMPIKFSDGLGALSNALAGMKYAIDNGADVSNLSWGGSGGFSKLYELINNNPDHIFIAAAGNYKSNIDNGSILPGSIRLPNLITVTSFHKGKLAKFANYGIKSVKFAVKDNEGTSFATAETTGAVALIKHQRPNAVTQDILDALFAAVKPVFSLRNKVAFGGKLSFKKLRNQILPYGDVNGDGVSDYCIKVNQTIKIYNGKDDSLLGTIFQKGKIKFKYYDNDGFADIIVKKKGVTKIFSGSDFSLIKKI